jgi:hypothetical protein
MLKRMSPGKSTRNFLRGVHIELLNVEQIWVQ